MLPSSRFFSFMAFMKNNALLNKFLENETYILLEPG